MRAAIVLVLSLAWPGYAAAQQIDLVGTWACSIAEYGSGEAGAASDSVFNLALYRSGAWASSGRFANGSPYQGQGTWRFGRNVKGGFQVTVKGNINSGIALPEPFEFEADLEGNDAFSRITKRYNKTTAVECARTPAS